MRAHPSPTTAEQRHFPLSSGVVRSSKCSFFWGKSCAEIGRSRCTLSEEALVRPNPKRGQISHEEFDECIVVDGGPERAFLWSLDGFGPAREPERKPGCEPGNGVAAGPGRRALHELRPGQGQALLQGQEQLQRPGRMQVQRQRLRRQEQLQGQGRMRDGWIEAAEGSLSTRMCADDGLAQGNTRRGQATVPVEVCGTSAVAQ